MWQNRYINASTVSIESPNLRELSTFHICPVIRATVITEAIRMHISRHSFAHIAQESGAESFAIKNILGHSNLATTERYMGSFDTAKTGETLRNVFAKKKTSAAADDTNKSKEEQATELLKGLSPEQIMAVISAISK